MKIVNYGQEILETPTQKVTEFDEDLVKFDRIQNKIIKKMKQNTFFSLGLQRDIHILQAGLRADSTLDGQLGFHRDFLRVARNLNNRFIKTFKNQLALINNH